MPYVALHARHLVLASASPRRRALLESAGFPFQVMPVQVDEVGPGDQEDPWWSVRENARRKAVAATRRVSGSAVVLAADTILVVDSGWIGKPGTPEEALGMLEDLGGKTHQVATAVSLLGAEVSELFVEVTSVLLKPITTHEIQAYHAVVDPLDKAGGYDIHQHGPLPGGVVASIEGSYSNVMGLPMERLSPLLADFIGPPPDDVKQSEKT